MFRVGQKVVCVNDTPGVFVNGTGGMDGLTKGSVYTVRAIGPNPFWGDQALWLVEIVRPLNPSPWEHLGEMGYDIRRFRPVVERKTSIEIFQRMLTPKKEHVNA